MNRAYSLLTIKAVDQKKRVITGIATTPTVDRVGDIIEPLGCRFVNPLPFLWQHDHQKPIGTCEFGKASAAGIPFTATLAHPDSVTSTILKERFSEAWDSISTGLVRATSIGFRPIEYSHIEGGGVRFTETEVFELSAVTVPAQAEAIIDQVKSAQRLARFIGDTRGASPTRPAPVVKLTEKERLAMQIRVDARRRADARKRLGIEMPCRVRLTDEEKARGVVDALLTELNFEVTGLDKLLGTTLKLSQLNGVFLSLGVSTPASIAAFRQLVEAQDLATAAGRSTYATLLQLAPAFADLQKAMEGAKSAADVLAEREDLERRLLELAGDTAAIRALDLAKLDASNRGLQQQVWAVEDAQAAAKAAGELRDAWASVGKSILDEVDRIRGAADDASSGGFAAAMGRFNAATDAARAGDQDAAKSLPALSQALLKLAGESATSRQELDRVSAATADSLSDTARLIAAMTGSSTSPAAILTAASAQAAAAPIATTASQAEAMEALRQEIADMRREIVAGIVTTASNTGALVRRFDDVTAQSGGDAISTVQAA